MTMEIEHLKTVDDGLEVVLSASGSATGFVMSHLTKAYGLDVAIDVESKDKFYISFLITEDGIEAHDCIEEALPDEIEWE